MCYPPVRNTFIHFSQPLPRPRSLSSPPQLFADLVLKQKEVQAKWRLLVEGTLKDDAMANEILYKLAKTHDNTTPKCRARVSEHIYKQIRYCVMSDDIVSDEISFRGAGSSAQLSRALSRFGARTVSPRRLPLVKSEAPHYFFSKKQGFF